MAEQESLALWSTTAATNASIDPAVNWAEGQLPSTVNNSNRAMMAALARYKKDNDGSLTTGGSANAYTLTVNGRQDPLATGHALKFKASFANTAAATIAVTNADAVALGTKAIRGPGDVALASGQMISGGVYMVRYDTAANSAAGAWLLINPGPDAGLMPNFIGGLTLSNDGGSPNTVLDIAAGGAADSTNTALIKIGAFTKSTAGAWSAGSGSNGMGNGLTIANSTWYHVFLANNGGAADVWFDTSSSGANRPTGITDTKARRLGSFRTNSSAQILAFTQVGNEFILAVPILDANGSSVPTSATLFALTMPTGIKVMANFRFAFLSTAANALLFQSPDETSAVASATAGNADAFAISGVNLQAYLSVRTNTSGQVRWSASTTGGTAYISTIGWTDWRGNT